MTGEYMRGYQDGTTVAKGVAESLLAQASSEKATLMRRIDELCAEVERIKDGAAKIRRWYEEELKAALEENAKLRELVRDLYYETKSPSNHATQVEIRMSELGIEVEE